MEKYLLRHLQREVERQCHFALIALGDIDESCANGQGHRFWYSIQNLLVALGRISRLLWPPEERETSRGSELRESLGVSEDSPLRSREFAEYFEHFDQYLENWHASSEHHRFFDSYTEPLDVLASTEPGDRFRGFDTENYAILFHGEMYRLQPVADAVEDVLERAERETQKPRFGSPKS